MYLTIDAEGLGHESTVSKDVLANYPNEELEPDLIRQQRPSSRQARGP